ncbi:achaete-scute complex T5 [Brachionus plicatilis]|uniref:Achaete-scute complex T5 n=1 Tax=Brachionus plicatilis TaxID=10195 RepID=A0A3M7Q0Q4_BRAPC|nr:achaete-scute complex T5 [Brachionus plicatilis]
MQSYHIKSELNVLVNSTNSKLEPETPYCRKKLDFQTMGEKKSADSIQSFELSTTSFKKGHFAKAPSNSKRNARERRRVRTINDYFSQLQKYLPHTKPAANGSGLQSAKKMSKVETLKAAIEYIEYLVKFAPANSQQLFQLSKSGSSASSLMSSPASSVCSNSTQILADKFKATLNKACSSPSKVAPSSPSTIQNTSTCSTPKSNCAESVYATSQLQQYQNSYPPGYYNYTECNYYNTNYYYNNQGYSAYPENYENSNSFNGYYPNEVGTAQINIQMSPVNKSNMSSCSSSSLSSTTGSNFYHYNNNDVKAEYYLNECESGLNI